MPPKLEMMTIIVEDMPASLAFYRQLGYEIPDEANSLDHVEVTLEGGLRMGWDTAVSIREMFPWDAPKGSPAGTRVHRCNSPTEVDELHDKLASIGKGTFTAPWDATWGERYSTVLDPDGNAVDLCAEL